MKHMSDWIFSDSSKKVTTSIMKHTDVFIIDKVFPVNLKKFMLLLCSRENVTRKITNYIERSYNLTIRSSNALPLDVNQFLKILKIDFILPSSEKDSLTVLPVFFSLSKNVQHNVHLFFNLIKLNDFQQKDWQEFLEKNTQHLDCWSKVINKSGDFNFEMRKDLQNRLKKLKKGVVCDYQLPKKSNTSAEKIEIVSNCDDFIMLCDEEKSLKNKLDKEVTPEREVNTINVENIKSELERNNTTAFLCTTGMPIMKVLVDPKIINEVHTLFSREIINFVFNLFTDCTTDEDKKTFCKALQFENLKEDYLELFVSCIDESEMLTDYSEYILRQTFMIRFCQLKEPISRKLLSLMVDLIRKNQQNICNITCENFMQEDFGSLQEDGLKKILLHEQTKTEDISFFLNQLYSEQNSRFVMNESHVAVLEVLFQRRPQVDQCVITNLLLNLANNFILNKSLKIMKLVIVLIANYNAKFTDCHKDYLTKIINQNSSFLRKKALNLMNTLSLK